MLPFAQPGNAGRSLALSIKLHEDRAENVQALGQARGKHWRGAVKDGL